MRTLGAPSVTRIVARPLDPRGSLEDELDYELHVEFLARAEARCPVEVADRVAHHAKPPD